MKVINPATPASGGFSINQDAQVPAASQPQQGGAETAQARMAALGARILDPNLGAFSAHQTPESGTGALVGGTDSTPKLSRGASAQDVLGMMGGGQGAADTETPQQGATSAAPQDMAQQTGQTGVAAPPTAEASTSVDLGAGRGSLASVPQAMEPANTDQFKKLQEQMQAGPQAMNNANDVGSIVRNLLA